MIQPWSLVFHGDFPCMLGMTGGLYFSLFVYSNFCRKNKNSCVLNNNRGSSNNLTNKRKAFPSMVYVAARRSPWERGCHLMHWVKWGWEKSIYPPHHGLRNGTAPMGSERDDPEARQARVWILTLPLASCVFWLLLLPHNKHSQT